MRILPIAVCILSAVCSLRGWAACDGDNPCLTPEGSPPGPCYIWDCNTCSWVLDFCDCSKVFTGQTQEVTQWTDELFVPNCEDNIIGVRAECESGTGIFAVHCLKKYQVLQTYEYYLGLEIGCCPDGCHPGWELIDEEIINEIVLQQWTEFLECTDGTVA